MNVVYEFGRACERRTCNVRNGSRASHGAPVRVTLRLCSWPPTPSFIVRLQVATSLQQQVAEGPASPQAQGPVASTHSPGLVHHASTSHRSSVGGHTPQPGEKTTLLAVNPETVQKFELTKELGQQVRRLEGSPCIRGVPHPCASRVG